RKCTYMCYPNWGARFLSSQFGKEQSVKAILFDQPGDADVLRYDDAPDPQPGADELLVRVHATAVNRADLLQRRGGYAPPPGASARLRSSWPVRPAHVRLPPLARMRSWRYAASWARSRRSTINLIRSPIGCRRRLAGAARMSCLISSARRTGIRTWPRWR